MKENTKIPNKIPRAPIVVVMGHIDHGKSTILDYIRKTNTTDAEQGGITQHLAAYQAHGITFLDTPGHAAFSSIRQRGSMVADIAVLVVSAEDGVKPQTVEAIDWIKKSGIPFIVAINKIDKPNANIEKAKSDLAEKEVLVEGWGGTVPVVAVSGKTGEGIPSLLETLILQAEVDGLSYSPAAPAQGYVIESRRDPKSGIEATLIIKDGVLRKGNFLVAGQSIAPVRLEEAKAGSPASISGWSEMPQVGLEFTAHENKKEAEQAKEEFKNGKKEILKEDSKKTTGKIVPVVIKADTVGSLEAIIQEIKNLDNEKIVAKIISYGIGSVSEGDVKLGKSSTEILILGFNVKVDGSAADISLRDNVAVKVFNIIYDLTDFLKKEMEIRSPKEEVDEVSGKANVIKVFSKNKNKQVIGGKVEEGELQAGSSVKILRREVEIGDGHIRELQAKKVKVGKVEAGTEFGSLIESKIEIVSGDKVVCVRKVVK